MIWKIRKAKIDPWICLPEFWNSTMKVVTWSEASNQAAKSYGWWLGRGVNVPLPCYCCPSNTQTVLSLTSRSSTRLLTPRSSLPFTHHLSIFTHSLTTPLSQRSLELPKETEKDRRRKGRRRKEERRQEIPAAWISQPLLPGLFSYSKFWFPLLCPYDDNSIPPTSSSPRKSPIRMIQTHGPLTCHAANLKPPSNRRPNGTAAARRQAAVQIVLKNGTFILLLIPS